MNLFDNIDMNRFVENLAYMWKGMLGIFIVMGIIILSVVILSVATKKKDKKKDETEQ